MNGSRSNRFWIAGHERMAWAWVWIAERVRNKTEVMTRSHISFAALIVISVLLFWQTVSALVAYSLHNESCSHIILIPIVSLGLLFTERERMFQATRTSVRLGFTLILAGAVLYGLAQWRGLPLAGNTFLSGATLSLVLIWVGGFAACYGRDALRAAAFPMLFLLLMVPLPDDVLARTIYLLQRGSTEIGFLLFKIAGVSVLRQGFLLSVPGLTIEVAKECSGIRSSIALFITCLLLAHLFLQTRWRMLLFVLLAFPLAIIKNGLRIVTLTLLSLYVNPSFLTGSLHRDGGIVFFLLALVLLAPVLRLLQKSEPRGSSRISGSKHGRARSDEAEEEFSR